MDQFLKALIYSPAGHGKTVLLGTGAGDPRLSPMLIADFEGGVRSIASKIHLVKLAELGKAKPTLDKIDVVRIQSWNDFDDLYDFLDSDKNPYKSIGLDSLSEMNYLNLQTVVGQAATDNTRHDPDVAQQQDYLRSQAQMRKLIRFFRDLNMHVIFAAGALEAREPRTKKYQFRPALVGQLVKEIPGLVDTLGYLAIVEEENGNTYRALFVQPTERFMAKDRSEGGKLGEYIVNPTLPMILDILEGAAVPVA